MEANNFIKKFAWDKAKAVLDNAPKLDCSYSFEVGIYLDRYAFSKYEVYVFELKRLVESHELVEKCGGVDKVKQYLKDGNVFRFEEKPLMKQAVADVESCK